jgi:hypothetical protein
MKYLTDIRAGRQDPKLLEDLYQTARRENKVSEFATDLLACYQESPDNVLYAAWYYRLQIVPQPAQENQGINWKLAIPLSLIAGLVFALLSNPRLDFPYHMPYLILAWAPLGACFILAYLAASNIEYRKRAWPVSVALVGISIGVTLLAIQTDRATYRDLMIFHLPLVAAAGVGISLLGLRSDPQSRLAFLIKAIEVLITGGLYVMAGGVFAGITFGMFQAIGITISEPIMKFLLAGGAGAITVLAVATVYDPHVGPLAQKIEQGLGKLIFTAARLLLPLTLLVLMVYLIVIPFNFMQPFRNRDVLIVYNAGLFAVMALLVGVTPVHEDDLPLKYHAILRTGILAVATLTVLISLYALSATVYRTVLGGLTMNRVTIIGWNSINIAILALLIYKQFKHGPTAWVRSLQSAFSIGTMGYVAWTLFLIGVIPWLFR